VEPDGIVSTATALTGGLRRWQLWHKPQSHNDTGSCEKQPQHQTGGAGADDAAS